MTPNPECATVDTPIVDALHSMHDGKFLHLPVVDRGTRLTQRVNLLYIGRSILLYRLMVSCRWNCSCCCGRFAYHSCSCGHSKSSPYYLLRDYILLDNVNLTWILYVRRPHTATFLHSHRDNLLFSVSYVLVVVCVSSLITPKKSEVLFRKHQFTFFFS